MNKRNVLIIGAIAAALASTVAFAQSAKDTEAAKSERGSEQTVEADAKRKAERRARNEAAAAARAKAKADKQTGQVEEEEERRKTP